MNISKYKPSNGVLKIENLEEKLRQFLCMKNIKRELNFQYLESPYKELIFDEKNLPKEVMNNNQMKEKLAVLIRYIKLPIIIDDFIVHNTRREFRDYLREDSEDDLLPLFKNNKLRANELCLVRFAVKMIERIVLDIELLKSNDIFNEINLLMNKSIAMSKSEESVKDVIDEIILPLEVEIYKLLSIYFRENKLKKIIPMNLVDNNVRAVVPYGNVG